MKRFLVVAGLVMLASVAQADVADREHLDAAVANLTAQISALNDKIDQYEANEPPSPCQRFEDGSWRCPTTECPLVVPAPTLFRQCRVVRGLEKCSRKYLKAVE